MTRQTEAERREARRLAKRRQREGGKINGEWQSFFGGSIEFGRLMLESDPELYHKVADLYYSNYPPLLRNDDAALNLLYPVRADSFSEALEVFGVYRRGSACFTVTFGGLAVYRCALIRPSQVNRVAMRCSNQPGSRPQHVASRLEAGT
jgi:hypothetical protein